MDYLDLVDELDRLIDSGSRMPLTSLALVKEQDVVALLARLRASVPPDARAVHSLRQECEHILARAREDADEVLLRAHEEVERLVHDPHLQRDARERADEVLREAEAKAETIRVGADAFIAATLEAFSQRLTDLATIMDRNLTALHEGAQTLRTRVAADLERDDLPIQLESTIVPQRSARQEYRMPPEESAPNPEPSSGPNSPAPESPLA
jgi:vacuolar-type H+-ATPase subunit H